MFPTTSWSDIERHRLDPAERRALLERLAKTYWRPLRDYARSRGVDPALAEDATQAVFARLLERDFVSALDIHRGRLRNYLRVAMNHYLADLRAHRAAAKRGGDREVVEIDDDLVGCDRDDPSVAFDRAWAKALLARAFERLRAEYAAGVRSGPFELIERYFTSGGGDSLAALADRFAMSLPRAKALVHRARGRFRELVRDEVALTVGRDADSAAELSHIESALTG